MGKRQETKPRLIDRQKRVVLPAEVLQALEVTAGDHVAFDVEGGQVCVRRVRWVFDAR